MEGSPGSPGEGTFGPTPEGEWQREEARSEREGPGAGENMALGDSSETNSQAREKAWSPDTSPFCLKLVFPI